MAPNKASSYQLRKPHGAWQVRFLDENEDPFCTDILYVSSSRICLVNSPIEWIDLHWPKTRWGARRLVEKLLSGRVESNQAKRFAKVYERERDANIRTWKVL